MQEQNKQTFIPYSVLPDSREWRVGHTYRAKMVMKQIGTDEKGANFEVVDATSLEPNEARKRYFLSDGGSYRG